MKRGNFTFIEPIKNGYEYSILGSHIIFANLFYMLLTGRNSFFDGDPRVGRV